MHDSIGSCKRCMWTGSGMSHQQMDIDFLSNSAFGVDAYVPKPSPCTRKQALLKSPSLLFLPALKYGSCGHHMAASVDTVNIETEKIRNEKCQRLGCVAFDLIE